MAKARHLRMQPLCTRTDPGSPQELRRLALLMLAHAVALYHSPFWSNVLEDQEGFFQFLMDIGVRMGNKRKHSSELPSAEPKSSESPAT